MWVRQCWATEKDKVYEFLPDNSIRDCWDTEVPAHSYRQPDLLSHAGCAVHHEADLIERHIFHIVGIHAQADVGEIKTVLLQLSDCPDGIVELDAVLVEVI
jgi:hypothetical protein